MSKKKSVTAVVSSDLVRRIVSLEKQKSNVERAVNREYEALAKLLIPKCEKAIGRKLRTPGDLMDWVRKNAPELKALDETPGDNWEYWPSNRMIFGAYA
jgi:hypothetical protein